MARLNPMMPVYSRVFHASLSGDIHVKFRLKYRKSASAIGRPAGHFMIISRYIKTILSRISTIPDHVKDDIQAQISKVESIFLSKYYNLEVFIDTTENAFARIYHALSWLIQVEDHVGRFLCHQCSIAEKVIDEQGISDEYFQTVLMSLATEIDKHRTIVHNLKKISRKIAEGETCMRAVIASLAFHEIRPIAV